MADAMKALNQIFAGIIGAIIIGAFIVTSYPLLNQYYGNTTVFLLGSIVLLIMGVVPFFYLFKVIQDAFKDDGDKRYGGFQQ